MYIKDIFANKKPVLSFEVFPPKKSNSIESVTAAIDEMAKLPIDYMSVTYGAGGSTSKRLPRLPSIWRTSSLLQRWYI